MPIAYPAGLPTVLASKRTSKVAPFSMAQPRRGTPYVEPTGTDTPTIFDVEWVLLPEQALVLRDWVYTTLRGGALQFSIPLRTEDGVRYVTGNFMPDGLLDRSREGTLWRYRATIVARDGLGSTVEPPEPDLLYSFVTHLYKFDSAETTAGPFINSVAGGPSATVSSTAGGALLLPDAALLPGSVRAVRANVVVSGGGVHLVATRSTTPTRDPWCIDALIKRLPDIAFEGHWENGGLLQFTNFAFFVRGNGTDGGAGPAGTAWQPRFAIGGVVQSRGTSVMQVGVPRHVALSWSPVGVSQGRWRCFVDGVLNFDTTLSGDNNLGGQTTVRIGPSSNSTNIGTLPFELDMWRLTVGNARYTDAFTPPSDAANYLPP